MEKINLLETIFETVAGDFSLHLLWASDIDQMSGNRAGHLVECTIECGDTDN